MTGVLQALERYYVRMAERGEVDAPGLSREKISFAIEIDAAGEVVTVLDLREQKGKRLLPATLTVPAAVKRTVAILPNLFWDKTAYVLGRTAGDGKRTAQEHAAFRQAHLDLLAGTDDPGLIALARFLENWTPERFDAPPFHAEMLDANIVFRLEGDFGFIHERPAAYALLAAGEAGTEGEGARCLVTGRFGPVARLHPTIKGVDGAQSSGAALVSFNLDAFTSYGKDQGDNAPTSEEAALRYGAALNRLLDRNISRNRLRIGDTTVVFWAEAPEPDAAEAAEDVFRDWFGEYSRDEADDAGEAAKLSDAMSDVVKGRPVEALDPRLMAGTRFHVLGLAPNAARLSIRFWLVDDFSTFATLLAQHAQDVKIEPRPHGWGGRPPSVQRLLVKTTALQEKFDNIPNQLTGEVLRSILTGARYPRTLLTAAITRLRAGDDPATGWHAAVIRAVLARDFRLSHSKEELPVSLDRDNPSPAYQLGRLFAAVETAQRLALGMVNATIRDRYFGAASATPATVFPLLMRGAQNHLGKLRKNGKGSWLEREIEEISNHLPPELPRSLRLEAQGRFVLGYYHQRRSQFASREAQNDIQAIETEETTNDE